MPQVLEKESRKIVSNKVRCIACGSVLESTGPHDIKFCKCGYVGITGGCERLGRYGHLECIEDLSEFEDEGEENL